MTENIFTRVKSYMKSQSFSVNDSWLSECVEYFIVTNPQTNAEAVQKFVQEQFLLSDLREINNDNGCLPENLTQQKHTTLNGRYILQLLKLYDISVSKFKQLEKIRNVAVDNIEATKEEKTQNWEPTGKRMLQLFLTDGIQEILAIEYKPIRTLNDSLFPGLKLMIIGPVTSRRGVILLEETNISIKGGEVEDLLIPNALENVLAKELKMTQNPDPYNDVNGKNKKAPVDDFGDDLNIDFEELDKIERSQEAIQSERPPNLNPSNYNASSNSTRVNSNYNQRNIDVRSNQNGILDNIDEFPNDEDLIFEDFEIEEIAPAPKNNNNRENSFKTPKEPISKPREDIEPKPSTSSSVSQFPDDDFDLNDVDFEMEEGWDEPMELPKSKNNFEPDSSFRNDSRFRESNVEVARGSKRSAGDLSPLSISNSKVRCAQSTPTISKINRKITDFIDNKSPKEKLPTKICDYICDILTLTLTNQPIRKTVRGKVTGIGKLTKKNLLWILEGTILDESASIDVEFSSQFMDKILGLSVSEFSQRKKEIKINPKMEEELRRQLLDGQNKLQIMDCLMELELQKDKKPVVMSSRELTQDQKNAYNKRFRMLKAQMM